MAKPAKSGLIAFIESLSPSGFYNDSMKSAEAIVGSYRLEHELKVLANGHQRDYEAACLRLDIERWQDIKFELKRLRALDKTK